MTQLDSEVSYRPPIKCICPKTGNPISCDWDDIDESNWHPLQKDENGFRPVKVILGGPSIEPAVNYESAR